MDGLKWTTKEDGHKHIAYIRRVAEEETIDPVSGERLVGITSKVNGHAHEVWYRPESAVQDPSTGQQSIIPEQYYIKSNNGHMHDIGDPILVNEEDRVSKFSGDPNDNKEKERLDYYFRVVNEAHATDQEYLRSSKTAEDIYYGGEFQWPEHIKSELKKQNRPFLAFNVTEGRVNQILGMHLANPPMPLPKGVESGDNALADIFSHLINYDLSKNDWDSKSADIFLDELITGRGNVGIGIDISRNPSGDITIDHEDWDSVYYMPHKKKDLSDCDGQVLVRYVTKDYLKMIAPENKKEDIENLSQSSSYSYHTPGISVDGGSFHVYDANIKKFALIRVNVREYEERSVIFNIADDFWLGPDSPTPSWLLTKDMRKQILTIPGFEEIKRIFPVYKSGVIGGNILFQDKESFFTGYPIIPAYATKRRGRIKGKVFDMIDPQMEMNKRQTSFIEIMMKQSGPTNFVDNDTFESDEDLRQYKETRHIPNSVQVVRDTNEKLPIEMPPPQVPKDLLVLAESMEKQMTLITGINPEGISGSRGAQSTPLYQERRSTTLMSLAYLFDNFNVMVREMAYRMIDIYRNKDIYPYERIYSILQNTDRKMQSESKGAQGLMIDKKSFGEYTKDSIAKICDNRDIKINITIDFTKFTKTKQENIYNRLAFLAGQGTPGVTGDMVISVDPELPEDVKERIINQSLAAQQAEQQAREGASMAELQKVLTAQEWQSMRQNRQLGHEAAKTAAEINIKQQELDMKKANGNPIDKK